MSWPGVPQWMPSRAPLPSEEQRAAAIEYVRQRYGPPPWEVHRTPRHGGYVWAPRWPESLPPSSPHGDPLLGGIAGAGSLASGSV